MLRKRYQVRSNQDRS